MAKKTVKVQVTRYFSVVDIVEVDAVGKSKDEIEDEAKTTAIVTSKMWEERLTFDDITAEILE